MGYEEYTVLFESLCIRYGLPIPMFSQHSRSYDQTTAEEVRFCYGTRTKQDLYHLFGHWVCDLHADSADNGVTQDKIADMIGHLLSQSEG